jgi:hypothetical protein
MRWTKRLRYRWQFLNGLLSNPEEQPADAAALAALHATQLESRTATRPVPCAHCHRTRRNPHQVRAGRMRARSAARDERDRFICQNAVTASRPNAVAPEV